jgi:hypothetical protein
MGAQCTVCQSKDRYRIEFGLARRVAVQVLARRYGLSADAVYRHRKHVPPSVMIDLRHKADLPEQELAKLRVEESGGLLEHLVVQRAKLIKLVDSCEEVGDYAHAIAAHGKITANLELTGKLLDVFAAHAPIHQNITISADYLKLRSTLLATLKRFPEARRAILEALRANEPLETETLAGEVMPSVRAARLEGPQDGRTEETEQD